MLYVIIAIDENIVDVNDTKVVEILTKNFINETLKRLENVAQIEEHYYVLVQVVSSNENDFFWSSSRIRISLKIAMMSNLI